jgi:serine/threonine protein kinase
VSITIVLLVVLIFSRALQAAIGLKYLSDKNIVHRDVSLRNLLAASGVDHQRKLTVKVCVQI